MSYTKIDYAELLLRLESYGEPKFKAFNEGLIPNLSVPSYGVRVPEMRAVAKEIANGDWRGFLDIVRDKSYEEIMLWGMVTAMAKCDTAEKIRRLSEFVPKVDNWAVCDVVCSCCKWKAAEKPAAWDFAVSCLESEGEGTVRFGVVQLMDYFIDEEHIDDVLALYKGVKHEGYYVKMALAWALSVCFVKQRDKTLKVFENRELDKFVHNKGIQKCRESYRVTRDDKVLLNALKIK